MTDEQLAQNAFERLEAHLVTIRGGECSEYQLDCDLAEWIAEHGTPTSENVDRWAEDSFELRFGLEVLKRKAK